MDEEFVQTMGLAGDKRHSVYFEGPVTEVTSRMTISHLIMKAPFKARHRGREHEDGRFVLHINAIRT